jgi:hypothetical protein
MAYLKIIRLLYSGMDNAIFPSTTVSLGGSGPHQFGHLSSMPLLKWNNKGQVTDLVGCRLSGGGLRTEMEENDSIKLQ